MPARFYHPDALIHAIQVGQQLILTPDAYTHAIKVLRMVIGDTLVLFSGQGGELLCKIIQTKPKAIVEVINTSLDNKSSPLQLHLGQGIARGDKMDFIIQKAVELGCAQITPLITQKSQVKLNDDRKEKRFSHWQKIVISAAEQSGLNILPVLHEPCKIEEWIRNVSLHENTPNIMFHPDTSLLGSVVNSTSNSTPIIQPSQMNVLIGSESGLSDDEAKFALEHRFQMATLGPRILRTETATITALSLIQSYFGDLPKF